MESFQYLAVFQFRRSICFSVCNNNYNTITSGAVFFGIEPR